MNQIPWRAVPTGGKQAPGSEVSQDGPGSPATWPAPSGDLKHINPEPVSLDCTAFDF